MQPRHTGLLYLALAMAFPHAARAATTTITFDEQSNSLPLPYSEDGFTFAEVEPSFSASAGNGSLFFSGSGGSEPYHVRAMSAQPFDLLSIDLFPSFFHTWRFESPSGAAITVHSDNPPGGTVNTHVDFAGMPGWSNIEYFDIIHDYGGDRRSLTVDHVVVELVPEPAAFTVVSGLALPILSRRRERTG